MQYQSQIDPISHGQKTPDSNFPQKVVGVGNIFRFDWIAPGTNSKNEPTAADL